MSFNALKEKGIPLEKQLRNWHQIVGKPYNKTEVDCYTRTRQILMNGIEVESWGFKHQFNRFTTDEDIKSTVAILGRLENMQQMTANWMGPADQSVLETTLGYEQVAVDLTAWMAQNEPDKYVRKDAEGGSHKRDENTCGNLIPDSGNLCLLGSFLFLCLISGNLLGSSLVPEHILERLFLGLKLFCIFGSYFIHY